MSVVALQEIEKIERFYLNSCTDLPLPLATSMHQSFPPLNEIACTYSKQFRVKPSRIPRSHSQYGGRTVNGEGPDATYNRAKLAFLKMCESLDHASGVPPMKLPEVPSESCEQDEDETNDTDIPSLSMSKGEFIQKLEEGYIRSTDMNRNLTIESPKEQIARKHAKSDSVLAKSVKDNDNTGKGKYNNSKSTTAISNDVSVQQQVSCPRLHSVSTTSKVIVTGFFLLIMLGFVKNAVTG